MYDIVSLGGASVDVFIRAKNEQRKHEGHVDVCYHLNDKVLIDELIFTTGGGGTNTSVAFARLGLKAGFIGLLGKDLNSEIILNELKREKVDFLGSIKKGNTGYSVVLAGQRDRSILVSRGLNNELTMQDIHLKEKTKWLHVSAMLDKSFETSKKLIQKLKKQGTKVTLNIGPYMARKGLDSLSQTLKKIDVLTMNKDESKQLTGKSNIDEAFQILSKYCKGIIVITDGPNPVYAYANNRVYIREVKNLPVVDNTGCGDAFSAGLTYAVMKGKDIMTCLNMGLKESYSILGFIGAKNNLAHHL